ncbi:uncharacterized protein N7459_002226 [Penicillium hispanicum]|uniref:uncharacterized protein n=1 Tax=Penicillium hispanicum TaxID=1080232 RepID=UPI0025410690|nr:uncharacterized protein N7459_002226 [Penicillium hispanicum]KAJ5591857.1 hypothetical protein N7459_002226 [Penicillium hispanicum]
MDVILDVLDTFVFDRCYASLLPDPFAISGNNTLSQQPFLNHHVKVYYPLEPSQWAEASRWKRDHMARQTVSLFIIAWIFATLMYLLGSFAMYHLLWDKKLTQHPRFLPHQIRQELHQGLTSIPIMAALTVPFFLAEIRGYSKLYDLASDAPFAAWSFLQYPLFIFFTDSGIYWIHRYEHHPRVYRWLHKPHHKWVVPTPFASYAFHPLDGWAQSLPYHVFPLLFPLQKAAYLGLFMFVTMWTVLIHDAEYLASSVVVNGASCHTMHHLYFNYNYGQFLTFWDRLGGTYRTPQADKFMETHLEPGKVAKKTE